MKSSILLFLSLVVAAQAARLVCERELVVPKQKSYVVAPMPTASNERITLQTSSMCLFTHIGHRRSQTYQGHLCSPHGWHRKSVTGVKLICKYGNRQTLGVFGYYKPVNQFLNGETFTGKGFPVLFLKKPIGNFISNPEYWYLDMFESMDCAVPYWTLAAHLMKPTTDKAFEQLYNGASKCASRINDPSNEMNVGGDIVNTVILFVSVNNPLAAAFAQTCVLAYDRVYQATQGADPRIVDRNAIQSVHWLYSLDGNSVDPRIKLPAGGIDVVDWKPPAAAFNFGSHKTRITITLASGSFESKHHLIVYNEAGTKLLTMAKGKLSKAKGKYSDFFYYQLAIPSNHRVCFQLASATWTGDSMIGSKVCVSLMDYGHFTLTGSRKVYYQIARW